ncbi:MAG: hypothetical protein AAB915_02405 [Patescibacteria group bacterium]
MRRSTRRLFFYSLVLLFAVAGPVLVAYSFGYTYDFSRAQFRQNGGIFVKSKTPRTSVFLDGTFVKETGIIIGSALLTDVSPRRHLVRLEKQGYRAWSKVADVKPALVTEFRFAVLIPNPVRPATTTPEEFAKIASPALSPVLLIRDTKGGIAIRTGGAPKTVAANVHSYGAGGGTVLFVDKNGFLARYDTLQGTTDTVGRPGFYLTEEAVQFFPSPSGDFTAILDPSGGLFLFSDSAREIKTVAGGVRAALFDGEEEKLLIRKEHGIDILWLKENKFQPFQKAGAQENIITLEEVIKDAAWFYGDDAHLAFATRDGIFFTEIDGRGGRNTAQISAGPAAEIAADPAVPHAIFFKKGKTAYRIEL